MVFLIFLPVRVRVSRCHPSSAIHFPGEHPPPGLTHISIFKTWQVCAVGLGNRRSSLIYPFLLDCGSPDRFWSVRSEMSAPYLKRAHFIQDNHKVKTKPFSQRIDDTSVMRPEDGELCGSPDRFWSVRSETSAPDLKCAHFLQDNHRITR